MLSTKIKQNSKAVTHPHWDCVTFETKNATLTHTMTILRLIKKHQWRKYFKALVFF